MARLHYLDENPSGTPTVLLLHGLGATGASWAPNIPALVAAGFRVLAPDARGFGQSAYPGGGTSVAIMATDVADLLADVEVETAHVVGASMGGTIALQLALDHSELVDKLALVGTFATMRPRRIGVWLYIALRLLIVHTVGLPAQARVVAKRIFPKEDQAELRRWLIDQICQADPRGYRATGRALLRFDLSSRLGEIDKQTLVVSGENDTTVPLATQEALVRGIPKARHVVIPDGGHAVISDQTEAFDRVLLDFLLPGRV